MEVATKLALLAWGIITIPKWSLKTNADVSETFRRYRILLRLPRADARVALGLGYGTCSKLSF
jgi:hypothetical protein